MDRSPKGREIERVEGTPGDIVSRGEAIKSLGTKMLNCADTLETIKNESVGDGSQKGKAIEKLKESIGDSHSKLREAGELYEPVGPVITSYGNALDSCQPVINTAADDCEELWTIYESLPGDRDGSTTPEAGGGVLGVGGYDKDSPEAKEKAENNEAKGKAYDAWHAAAVDFDDGYDSWESAFDAAVDDISDELSGSIKDGFWDNISSVVEVLVTVLSWAALVIGVIAFFAGGWVIAAIALAIGALVLGLTALQWANGDKTFTDVLLAGLAIIPVGKLAHLGKLLQLPKLAKVMGTGNGVSRVWGGLSKGPISKLMTARGDKPFELLKKSQIADNIFGPSMKSVRAGNYKMYFNGGYEAAKANLPVMRKVFPYEYGLGKLSALAGHYGKVATAVSNSGGSNIKLPPWVGVVL